MKNIIVFIVVLASIATHSRAQTPVPAPAMPGKNVPAIKVDTVGYPTDWTKMAVFNRDPKGAVVKDEKGQTFYRVKPEDIRPFGKDPASLDPVWQVDFSGLTQTGRYVMECGDAKSDPFSIGPDPYQETFRLSLKMFYFQRCRTALVEPYAVEQGNAYLRKTACHEYEDVGWDMADYPAKKRRYAMDAGWHDAGNFDMYICSTGPACIALLLAYERHPDLFKELNLNIPESGNGTPDILNECRWGLRWILCMQDKSGGFRARDSSYNFSPEGPADADRRVRWVAGIGTASTAKACAALALASRLYQPFDPAFAKRCGNAAIKGWAFLEKHPEHMVVDGHESHEPLWDDGKDMPQEGGSRLAASVEMWRTFNRKKYWKAVEFYLKDPQAQPDAFLRASWVDISRWPVLELVDDLKTPEAVRQDCRDRIQRACQFAIEVVNKDGYRCTQGLDGYVWSSNMIMMEEALLLSEWARLNPSDSWAREAARDQWHWLLGRNPNGYSMVTGVGKIPTSLFHGEWGKYVQIPPGYLEGGPNSHEAGFLAPGAPAKCLLWDNPKPLTSGLPAHHLWHEDQHDFWEGGFVPKGKWPVGWWVVTEPDINSNADFVLAAADFME